MNRTFYIFFQNYYLSKIIIPLFMISTIWVKSLSMNTDNNATQAITLEVKPIIKLSVNGNPNPLFIGDTVPGSELLTVTDKNTTYNLSTNLDNLKIVASINDHMPTGTKLMMKLSCSKATSIGLVDVSNAGTPVEIVAGINKGCEVNQTICYVFSADPNISEIPRQSRLIILTLTN